jgi:hypothetical protein
MALEAAVPFRGSTPHANSGFITDCVNRLPNIDSRGVARFLARGRVHSAPRGAGWSRKMLAKDALVRFSLGLKTDRMALGHTARDPDGAALRILAPSRTSKNAC